MGRGIGDIPKEQEDRGRKEIPNKLGECQERSVRLNGTTEYRIQRKQKKQQITEKTEKERFNHRVKTKKEPRETAPSGERNISRDNGNRFSPGIMLFGKRRNEAFCQEKEKRFN